MKDFFIILFIFFCGIYSATFNINSCSQLQGMVTNNNMVIYNITSNIDCASINPFNPIGKNFFFGKYILKKLLNHM